MMMNFIAPKLSVEIVVGQGPVVRLHRTDRRKLEVSNNIHYPAL